MNVDFDFPFIYCNGDSYTDENYRNGALKGKTYAHFVSDHWQGYALNKAISGSCNRRIIRTTVHDILAHRTLNPTQPTVVLIGLSFDLRSELWIDGLTNDRSSEETNFRTHAFTSQIDWRENLLKGLSMETRNPYNLNKKFYEYYSKGRAYFYSPYAERINLFCDIIMLRSLLESLNVNFLIFSARLSEKLDSDYLLDFFTEQLKDDPRIFNFENFGFAEWCIDQNKFTPIDQTHHYGPDAHRAFANEVLIPKINELKLL